MENYALAQILKIWFTHLNILFLIVLAAGGTVAIVEGGVKICQFPYAKLNGNCRDYVASGFYPFTDSCIYLAGWSSYKNWSTTVRPASTTYCHVDGQGATPNILVPHAWSGCCKRTLLGWGNSTLLNDCRL